jgi:guanine deaminase
MDDAADLMRLAIDKARAGVAAGQSPFGCAIARQGRVLAVAHNTVWLSTDPTAHAEVNAIREACRLAGSVHLAGAVVATTCEPCPMCMAALHWARVERVWYGATIADAAAAGFNELSVPAAELAERGGRIMLSGGLLAEECRALFSDWRARAGRPY